MRVAGGLIALGLFLGGCAGAEPRAYDASATLRFEAIEVSDPEAGERARLRSAYMLKPEGTSHFAGLSDLLVHPKADGLRIEAISDFGDHVAFDFRPEGPVALEIGVLKDAALKPFGNKTLSDAEDMAVDPETGDYYVSFEGNHRVMRYADGLAGPGEVLPLSGLPKFPDNQGLEALTVHGRNLIIGAETGGFWRCGLTDYVCRQLKGLTTPGMGYALVSLAPLGETDDLLALYRYYTPWTGARSVLRRLEVDGDSLRLKKTILTIKPPLPHDNYEGVAAVKTDTGYDLYLLSDPIGDGPTRLLIFDWASGG
ncbi:esterase-like activity of phytase family protein [Asticcacaulis tiandongensis]|uniref:esterase-like activity of phytase family protein n=1 Tax=Asticcacaulis tiandongensis TaxID=2565365 RepID=UPI0015E86AD1|nr:esterase-like activity of phytase family protein [Asticcacaulis tiandongensis]